MPARNALNNENGDQIFKLYFASIRNAGDAKYVISDAETGEVYVEEDLGRFPPPSTMPTAEAGRTRRRP